MTFNYKDFEDTFRGNEEHIKSLQGAYLKYFEGCGNVLDIGCGAGGTLMPFVEAGYARFGCDVGGEYLHRGRYAGLTLQHGNTSSLAEYGPAKLAILSHVLEHLTNPIEELRLIAELLEDRGYLYVELPGVLKIHETYGDTLLFLQNAHLYHFTLATLSSIMARAGFRMVKGNEYISALFQKDSDPARVCTIGEYEKIRAYLGFLERDRLCRKYCLVRTVRSVCRSSRRSTARIARRILGDRSLQALKSCLARICTRKLGP